MNFPSLRVILYMNLRATLGSTEDNLVCDMFKHGLKAKYTTQKVSPPTYRDCLKVLYRYHVFKSLSSILACLEIHMHRIYPTFILLATANTLAIFAPHSCSRVIEGEFVTHDCNRFFVIGPFFNVPLLAGCSVVSEHLE